MQIKKKLNKKLNATIVDIFPHPESILKHYLGSIAEIIF